MKEREGERERESKNRCLTRNCFSQSQVMSAIKTTE